MKKKSHSKAGIVPKIDPFLEGLMAKLLDRLISLESKMDTVLSKLNTDPSKAFQTPEIKQPPRSDRTLYEAICADCHKVCEVPFRPSEDRAVYCKECFAKRKSGGGQSHKPSFPVLTPVAMPSKPFFQKPAPPQPVALPAKPAPGKTKKKLPTKKKKKK